MKDTEIHQGLSDSKLKSNSFSTAGLVLGIVSVFFWFIGILPLLTILLSAIGIGKVKSCAGKGKVQAWIGLVLGVLFSLVYMHHYGHI